MEEGKRVEKEMKKKNDEGKIKGCYTVGRKLLYHMLRTVYPSVYNLPSKLSKLDEDKRGRS